MENDERQVPVQSRLAAPDELSRMKCHVFWAYQHGKPVVFWTGSNMISLLPESLPEEGVIILNLNSNTEKLSSLSKPEQLLITLEG